ncbi:uncharacterized protein EAE98_006753 [Botrytis deweyae]|uniref:Uncharacterized protein n=1 Tax=Botrytis deweyae TaxID=2478750 RepID=A0ABQ7IJH2_9HELO|nr:uncharacterized protein EAE98_006753 [Botrytis deweyae]KAF7925528.1 hypothetical protein EAE98_006753 [Botrytis deweyae]
MYLENRILLEEIRKSYTIDITTKKKGPSQGIPKYRDMGLRVKTWGQHQYNLITLDRCLSFADPSKPQTSVRLKNLRSLD